MEKSYEDDSDGEMKINKNLWFQLWLNRQKENGKHLGL